MPTGIISFLSKDNLDFICLLHFREKIKGMGCLESLVMMTSCFLSSVLDIHQKDEQHTLLAPLNFHRVFTPHFHFSKCETFTAQGPPQHSPPSALVLHKLQQGHFTSHLDFYTFIALEQKPSIKKRCCRKPRDCKH